ncbi:EBNA-1 nuclear protein [Sphingopyxis sp. H038]|uniref:N-acetyltransferase DgcN n=1 Tax=unclassified Sphingopyxis TaxID=2614943 RepID=UPI000730AA8C|nr:MULTISPECIES: N-acetyltransferase DgcN [unclassified Sphingopyxis]KTE01455.1 EBNA-1 nuclear protein [Sphingopyxis sp. H012]KTE05332.1 EBNA-1 nuclear protein [Sphingopyxis sp. H093]KTE12619.1 EBNA-1 nuclear protein [Sphingopyxis sp. H053]KTE24315.1 EBNA-1 nuclear protein [Sphingopyxis sp. H080]KTE34812.1 EBNA-1 nuclear protein [Sphingopyxis sp. H038]
MIETPYLLYLGHSSDPADIKTSRGLAVFRPDISIGEYRHDDCPLTLDLPRMDFAAAHDAGARTLVLGIANAGGKLGEDLIVDALAAMDAGLDIASGLHHRLNAEPRLIAAAARLGRKLHDVRDPRPDIPIGNGKPRAGKRLLTVGTDCSVGKMYTTLCLASALEKRGVAADFRATGQTGILIAGDGVPLDAVVADFISGAIEQISPARSDDGWDLIEGQGSLYHPSFAGVSTGLLHGAQPDALVLCHDPVRPHMRGLPHYPLPGIAETLEANLRVARLTNADVQVVGIALNTSAMSEDEAKALCARTEAEFGLPTSDPYRFGVEAILDRLLDAPATAETV